MNLSVWVITYLIVNCDKLLSEARYLDFPKKRSLQGVGVVSSTEKGNSSAHAQGETLSAPAEGVQSSSGEKGERCCSDSCEVSSRPTTLPTPRRLGDDGYYCPDRQRWVHPETLLRGSTLNSKATRWEEGDLLIQRVPDITDFNCFKVGFKSGTSPGVMSVSGWSVAAGGASHSDGAVTQYYGLYNSVAERWTRIEEGTETKVFNTNDQCGGPQVELLKTTIIAKELMFCPLKVWGEHPLFHLSVRGCLLRQHGPMELYTLPKTLRGKETCVTDECWMDEAGELKPCMFYSNAGGYAPSAIYSQEGYTFPALADIGPLQGQNNEFFLEVDFPNIDSVSELKVSGGTAGGEQGAVTSFTLAYRDMYKHGCWTYVRDEKGEAMVFAEKVCGEPPECSHICPYVLEPPIITAGLRIYPQTWNFDKPFLRFDIRGCKIHTGCAGDGAELDDTQLAAEVPLDPLSVEQDLESEMEAVLPPDSLGIARVADG